jgi:hypothetical protein
MNCSFDLIVKNAYRTFGKFEVLKWIKKVRCEVLKFFIDLHKEIHKEIQSQPSILNTDGGDCSHCLKLSLFLPGFSYSNFIETCCSPFRAAGYKYEAEEEEMGWSSSRPSSE